MEEGLRKLMLGVGNLQVMKGSGKQQFPSFPITAVPIHTGQLCAETQEPVRSGFLFQATQE